MPWARRAPSVATKMPKILVVGPAPGQAGGIASVMSYLKTQTGGLGGYDVQFIDTMKDGRWSIARFVSATAHLCLIIIRCRFAVQPLAVHVNVSVRGSTYRKWFLAKVCCLLSTPYVVHLHGGRYRTFFAGSTPAVQKMIFGLTQSAVRLIVLGAVWRDFAVDELHVDASKVVIIPNGTPELFGRTGCASNSESDPIRVVFSGRLDAKKGLSDLLSATDLLYEEGRNFQLVLLGDSRDPWLLSDAESRPYCIVTGWLPHDEVANQLASADVFTLPSHDEGLPMAMLEAMSLGLPVVVTAVGAIPDVVVDGQEGFLIQPRDVDALSESLRTLISNRDLREQMGSNARARWRSDLGAERMTQRIITQWEAALASRMSLND